MIYLSLYVWFSVRVMNHTYIRNKHDDIDPHHYSNTLSLIVQQIVYTFYVNNDIYKL